MTSLNNPVNLPLDTNGYVKSNIYAQNINPNVNTVASVTGSVGNVTNPVSTGTTISHQTGLSGSNSTANAPTNVGTAISITKDGIISVETSGHVSANVGGIRIARTRAGVVDYINEDPSGETSTVMKASLFTDGAVSLTNSYGIGATTRCKLIRAFLGSGATLNALFIQVLNGDSLQFQVSNNVASDTTYIDDLVVIEQ